MEDESIQLVVVVIDTVLYFFNGVCILFRQVYQLRLLWRLHSDYSKDIIFEGYCFNWPHHFSLQVQKKYSTLLFAQLELWNNDDCYGFQLWITVVRIELPPASRLPAV